MPETDIMSLCHSSLHQKSAKWQGTEVVATRFHTFQFHKMHAAEAAMFLSTATMKKDNMTKMTISQHGPTAQRCATTLTIIVCFGCQTEHDIFESPLSSFWGQLWHVICFFWGLSLCCKPPVADMLWNKTLLLTLEM